MELFYAFAFAYLAIGLFSAMRMPGKPSRPGLAGHWAVFGAVLQAALLWPQAYVTMMRDRTFIDD